jgi:hypothetical protein
MNHQTYQTILRVFKKSQTDSEMLVNDIFQIIREGSASIKGWSQNESPERQREIDLARMACMMMLEDFEEWKNEKPTS